MYNYQYQKPEPFVPGDIAGRYPNGSTRPARSSNPSRDAVRAAARELREAGLDTIAVSYLHSYQNPEHERRTRELIADVHPDAYVTRSHELTKEYREYERTNTAVLNSYVRPIADEYLDTLEGRLTDQSFAGNTYAMKSNAGNGEFRAGAAQARRDGRERAGRRRLRRGPRRRTDR